MFHVHIVWTLAANLSWVAEIGSILIDLAKMGVWKKIQIFFIASRLPL